MFRIQRAGLLALICGLFLSACNLNSLGPNPDPTSFSGSTPAARSSATVPSAGGFTPTLRPPLTTNGPVKLFVEPDAGVTPIVDALNQAQRSIRMKIYLLSERTVIQALKDAAGRGVDVEVLIEFEPFGGGTGNQDVAKDLQANGVKVKATSRNFTFTHEKSIVIDERTALIMTLNLTRSSVTRNREYGLISTDPVVVKEVLAVWEADWNVRDPNLGQYHLAWSPINSRAAFQQVIQSAHQTLILEQEEMQDPDLQNSLASAAQSGVQVRVILPAPQQGANDGNAAGANQLRQAGAQVLTLADPYVHAKMIVADGQLALVGSINISTNSLEHNRELGMLLDRSNGADALNTLANTFELDWRAAGGSTTPSNVSPRSTLASKPAASAGTPFASSDGRQRIDWRDAAKYVDQDVVVEGTVSSTNNTGSIVFLDFGPRGSLSVVIRKSSWSKFSQPPEVLYNHKHLWIKGTIKLFNNSPEIAVTDPLQIEIIR